jgi:uncharacterized protein (DUF433 family)
MDPPHFPHAWRKQLYIKGRNMTVWQLVSNVRANQLTVEQAADNMELPVEAVAEALSYYSENRSLIESENDEERRWLLEKGYTLEPQHLHG